MIPRLYNRHYSRELKGALIFSLLLINLLFLFFPKIKEIKKQITVAPELFTIQDIPATRQIFNSHYADVKRPLIPQIKISNIPENPEILNDIPISHSDLNNGTEEYKRNKSSIKSDIDNSIFVPRQIKEVLPSKTTGEISGQINISLKIGKNGKVVKYKIISNTTGNSQCLENVIKAVSSSRWQVLEINRQKEEYWVDKVYNFR